MLNYISLVNYEEPLAISDGTKSVSNNDRSSPLHGSVEGLLHDFLTLLIEGTRGLVEDQDLGVLDQGSGDGDALLLATGKLGSFETALFVETFVKLEASTLPLALGKILKSHQVDVLDSFMRLGSGPFDNIRVIWLFFCKLDLIHSLCQTLDVKVMIILKVLENNIFVRLAKLCLAEVVFKFWQFNRQVFKSHDNVVPSGSFY